MSGAPAGETQDFSRRNIPLFIAYRILFHARFYYPVLGVLFLDLGLTLEQYALLNVIWAAAIVLCEVPSGALADAWGRKAMVVLSSALMVAEMAIFAFAPAGDPTVLFWLLVLNRVLSGLAEACGSGADEALAYDSLPANGREERWSRVLASLMKWKSAGFLVAMLTGAALFDKSFLNSLLSFFPASPALENTTRLPVYATLCTAVLALAAALLMKEPPVGRATDGSNGRSRTDNVLANLRAGARHVFTVPRVTFLIVAALLLDSFIRLFLTFASNYYRLIELPEVMNGVLGAAVAVLGFAVAPVARRMVLRHSAVWNFGVLFLLVLIGLIGLAAAVPYFGVWVLLPIGFSMSALQFFASYYLNQWTDSAVRATVLSFRGVALNLAYGTVGVAFASVTAGIRNTAPGASQDAIFAGALQWLPPGFIFCSVLVLGTTALAVKRLRGIQLPSR